MRFITKVVIFIAGFLTGIAAVAFYQIFGKPVLPKKLNSKEVPKLTGGWRNARGAIPWSEDGESTDNILRRLREGVLLKPHANSLSDLDETQPIKIEQEITAKDLEKWAEESC